ncbi:hypothetical protein T4D_14292 [Trichinella pseudospiralis]|uniref:Uncharacterized protein n=1 Tax=Trichinella pseudospiralis TaxID=6337 RepID=A0A0V1FD38_TRIPS|nr:hypothetical protein T4D_14292 [Trichinella pseudospiralis]
MVVLNSSRACVADSRLLILNCKRGFQFKFVSKFQAASVLSMSLRFEIIKYEEMIDVVNFWQY